MATFGALMIMIMMAKMTNISFFIFELLEDQHDFVVEDTIQKTTIEERKLMISCSFHPFIFLYQIDGNE